MDRRQQTVEAQPTLLVLVLTGAPRKRPRRQINSCRPAIPLALPNMSGTYYSWIKKRTTSSAQRGYRLTPQSPLQTALRHRLTKGFSRSDRRSKTAGPSYPYQQISQRARDDTA